MGKQETVGDVLTDLHQVSDNEEVFGDALHDVADRIQAAHTREVDALRADARRYRFMRGTGGCFGNAADWAECCDWQHEWASGDELDDCVDAAIAAQEAGS